VKLEEIKAEIEALSDNKFFELLDWMEEEAEDSEEEEESE
jgi:hypothetical protein